MDSIRNRFRGCLLGGAVGDALGAPVEFMKRAEIEAQYGAGGVNRYLPAYGGLGTITDDTQMSLFTAEGLLLGWADGCEQGSACLVESTRAAYLRWLYTQEEDASARADSLVLDGWLVQHPLLHERRGPGTTCLSVLRALRDGMQEAPVQNDRKGCGGLMRVAPAGLFFWRPEGAFSIRPAFMLARDLAGITHGHPTGQLSAGAFAAMVAALADGMSLSGALAVAKHLLARHEGHEETLLAIQQAESLAQAGAAPEQAIPELGEGWLADEALAIALYCALTAESFEHGVAMAVNHDGDSDSTGAVTGHLLGAALGVDAIPAEWLESLELREVITDMADRLATYWQAG
jgi:ADP-ribosylglycohydrolase